MSATKLFHAVSLLLVVGAITCVLVAGTPDLWNDGWGKVSGR